MNLDEDIIIEDKYGSDRNINELLDIDDVNLEHENQKDFSNFLFKHEVEDEDKKIKNETSSDKNIKKYQDFKVPKESLSSSSIKEVVKEKNNKNLGIFKLHTKSYFIATIFIALFSIVIIILKGDIRNTIWGAFRIPFEAVVFLILSFYIVRVKKQVPKIAGITCSLAGFFAGIFISIFKLFYHMELWAMFNIATESIFLLLTGLVLGLIFGALLYSVDDSLKNNI